MRHWSSRARTRSHRIRIFPGSILSPLSRSEWAHSRHTGACIPERRRQSRLAYNSSVGTGPRKAPLRRRCSADRSPRSPSCQKTVREGAAARWWRLRLLWAGNGLVKDRATTTATYSSCIATDSTLRTWRAVCIPRRRGERIPAWHKPKCCGYSNRFRMACSIREGFEPLLCNKCRLNSTLQHLKSDL